VRNSFLSLVIDDDDFTRQTSARILRKLGAGIVLEAADGAEALRLAHNHSATLDLIVCDLRMPQCDGIETLRGLAEANINAKVVLLSSAEARVLRSAREMALGFGIKSLLTVEKPLTLHKMNAILTEAEQAPAVTASKPGPDLGITVEDVWRGFTDQEFVAYFQPKVDLQTNRVAGAEALMRWVHPAHGILAPGAFLGVVQAGRLLDPLTDMMVGAASTECARWHRLGFDIGVNVNLSMASLSVRDLPPRLEGIVIGAGAHPEHITFEVTEDAWLHQDSVAREILTRLSLRGFHLSIDDFGTGYSTVQQLLQAPFGEMKIDQCFVRSALTDEESAIVLSSSIGLAHRLGLTVVAEGAETPAQLAMLRNAGCDQAQGYGIARPMPGDQFRAWLVNQARTNALITADDPADV
jgi:EAL domain-containing protein (putative c-di-GMP-specific phosphodiesterase class I)/ActR/RegA family two-component response regulator